MSVRIFSTKRLLLSVILGFLLPLSYAIILFIASEYGGITTPDFMVMPFLWPRPVWVYVMGRQPSDADINTGLIFMGICNILLYGLIVYAALLMMSVLTRKPIAPEPTPPPPEPFLSGSG